MSFEKRLTKLHDKLFPKKKFQEASAEYRRYILLMRELRIIRWLLVILLLLFVLDACHGKHHGKHHRGHYGYHGGNTSVDVDIRRGG